MNEVSLAFVQMITGHKDPRSPLRYVNPDEDDVSLIASKMAEVQKAKEAVA